MARAWRVGPAGPDEVRVVEAQVPSGTMMYFVTCAGSVAGKDGAWEDRVIGRARTSDYIDRTHSADWGEAVKRAERALEMVGV